jgi:hypothetical protein
LNGKYEDTQFKDTSASRMEQKLLICEELKNILSKIKKSPANIQNKNQAIEPEDMMFKVVGVIFYDGDSIFDLRYHSFRINKNTTFKNLKTACINFWDLKKKDGEIETENYYLKLKENEWNSSYISVEEEDSIDSFLKKKSNLTQAQFYFSEEKNKHEFIKIHTESTTTKNKNKAVKEFVSDIQQENMKSFTTFYLKFVGLANKIKSSYEKLKNNNSPNKQKNKISHKCNNVWKLVSYLILIAFSLFTVLSLRSMRYPNEAYLMRQSLKNKYGYDKGKSYLFKTLKESFIEKFKDLFFDPQKNSTGIINNICQASPIKISFYRSIEKYDCNLTATIPKPSECYESLFSEDPGIVEKFKLDYMTNGCNFFSF